MTTFYPETLVVCVFEILLSPALSTCSAVSCNSGKMEEAMSTTGYAYAKNFLAKYLGGRFEPTLMLKLLFLQEKNRDSLVIATASLQIAGVTWLKSFLLAATGQ
ncbi:MAG: hypothetical protein V7L04_22450 [Nostoc sp.]|uniref:hypothetical protein n=1 Tax=Nostoc sp. TaxID=1180 RepID=UPI002FF83635